MAARPALQRMPQRAYATKDMHVKGTAARSAASCWAPKPAGQRLGPSARPAVGPGRAPRGVPSSHSPSSKTASVASSANSPLPPLEPKPNTRSGPRMALDSARASHQAAVVVSLQLPGVDVQGIQDLSHALGCEVGDQSREGQVRPQAPHPPCWRGVLEWRQGVKRRAAHHLVAGMAVVGARGEDHVDRLLANDLGDQQRQLGLRRVEVVAGADRRGAAGHDQLESGANGGFPGLGLAALVIIRPPRLQARLMIRWPWTGARA